MGDRSISTRNTVLCDVCVIGGGPAGASLARRLAMLGHNVIVLEKVPFPRPQVGESITSSLLPLLDILGLRAKVEDAGLLRPKGSIVCWDSPQPEYRRPPADSGFQIGRDAFDEILLEGARAAGAVVLQPARLHSRNRDADGIWDLHVETKEAGVRIRSRIIADASGRSCVTGGKRIIYAQRLLALYAHWQGVPTCCDEMRIEAGPHEWYWGAQLPDGSFSAMVFLDPGRFKLYVSLAGSHYRLYHELLDRSSLLRHCLGGQLVRLPRICDASCYLHHDPVERGLIRAGEAAFTIDPVSSQGVLTAIGSALHAAVVLHTILERPGDAAIAQQFYETRIHSSVSFHARAARVSCCKVAERWATKFWNARAQQGGVIPAELQAPETPGWNDLVSLAPGVALVPTPVINGDFVTTALGLLIPGHLTGVVYLEGALLAALFSTCRGTEPVSVLIEKWRKTVPARIALKIFAWAIQNRAIIARSSTEA